MNIHFNTNPLETNILNLASDQKIINRILSNRLTIKILFLKKLLKHLLKNEDLMNNKI